MFDWTPSQGVVGQEGWTILIASIQVQIHCFTKSQNKDILPKSLHENFTIYFWNIFYVNRKGQNFAQKKSNL